LLSKLPLKHLIRRWLKKRTRPKRLISKMFKTHWTKRRRFVRILLQSSKNEDEFSVIERQLYQFRWMKQEECVHLFAISN
jgi:hypothetical protein